MLPPLYYSLLHQSDIEEGRGEFGWLAQFSQSKSSIKATKASS